MSQVLKAALKHLTILDERKKLHLKDIDPDPKHGLSKDEIDAKLEKLHEEMFDLQAKLHAEGKRSLLIVLQAMDAAGKDGTIKSVFSGLNPQSVEVSSFKEPSKEELAHDYLWRIHKECPPRGMIGIFNRSYYEDVTAVRVEKYAPKHVWEKRYDHINHFEQLLSDEGTVVRKFYLHISKDEQKRRFEERLQVPKKHWKFSKNDVLKRERWAEYMDAFEDCFEQCASDDAPWIIVPANDKHYRNLVVASVIVETLREMDPKYPEGEDLSSVKVPE